MTNPHSVPFAQPQSSLPACPEWLGDHGRDKWHELLPMLATMLGDRLAMIDGEALAHYCEAYEAMREAKQRLAEAGSHDCVGPNGALYPHPAVGEKNKAIERMAKLRKELGLAAATRKARKIDTPVKRKPA